MRTLCFLIAIGCGESSTGFIDTTSDTSPEPAGVLSVEPAIITWQDLEVGVSGAQEFVVSNIGDNMLDVERIDITNSGNGTFNLDEDANRGIMIEPGESHTAIGVAVLLEAGSAQGEFRIRSNDSNTPDFRITLCAYSPDQGTAVNNCEAEATNEEETGSSD